MTGKQGSAQAQPGQLEGISKKQKQQHHQPAAAESVRPYAHRTPDQPARRARLSWSLPRRAGRSCKQQVRPRGLAVHASLGTTSKGTENRSVYVHNGVRAHVSADYCSISPWGPRPINHLH